MKLNQKSKHLCDLLFHLIKACSISSLLTSGNKKYENIVDTSRLIITICVDLSILIRDLFRHPLVSPYIIMCQIEFVELLVKNQFVSSDNRNVLGIGFSNLFTHVSFVSWWSVRILNPARIILRDQMSENKDNSWIGQKSVNYCEKLLYDWSFLPIDQHTDRVLQLLANQVKH